MQDLQELAAYAQSKIDEWQDNPEMAEAVAAWRIALADLLEALNEQA